MIEAKFPKYYLVKQTLAKKIDNDEFAAENPIPSERELMERFGVSRITIRKAVDELVQEGYLYKIQGKGTYVKTDEGSSNLVSILSSTEDVLRLGMTPRKKMVASETVSANAKRAKALEISPSDPLFMIGRIMYANQEPLNYTITFLPEKLFPHLLQYELEETSLYQILQSEYGVRITKARRTIEAILAKNEIVRYLELEEDSPIILFRCITYGVINGEEIPFENFKCYYRTDKYRFYIDQIR